MELQFGVYINSQVTDVLQQLKLRDLENIRCKRRDLDCCEFKQ